MAGPWPKHDTRRKTYVLEEGSAGAPCDDISILDEPMIERVDTENPHFAGMARMPFPRVIESDEKGMVRSWCEAQGIKLAPHEFIEGQVDYIIELDTDQKRNQFKRKWLS
jgi:hypothetical protein